MVGKILYSGFAVVLRSIFTETLKNGKALIQKMPLSTINNIINVITGIARLISGIMRLNNHRFMN